ncbi:ATP/GTP-binding protein [Nocardia sp. NPDC004151]|uniref:AAA family ATPase n=1 Tax=Nocardia sp. NPDC004151 TaxID=3364304 RepID=UPI0036A49327
MVRSSLRRVHPPGGDWSPYLVSACAIYGPNASGKSTILDAISFARGYVKNSANLSDDREPRATYFRLQEGFASKPSQYSFDFLDSTGIRYEYGFELIFGRVQSEWLNYYPEGRPRLLFERNGEEFRFSRWLKGGRMNIEAATGPKDLALSKAAQIKHPMLSKLYREIVSGIFLARHDERDEHGRMVGIIHLLEEGKVFPSDIIALLRAADIGIANVSLKNSEYPDGAREVLDALLAALQSTERTPPAFKNITGAEIVEALKELSFEHAGSDGNLYPLESAVQSKGTLSWIALSVPAIGILRNGGVMLVDEIDASLHPRLSSLLVDLFRSKANVGGGQLVFTTHDTYFLSRRNDSPLEPDEVWFTEKSTEGVTSLYSLADFLTRNGENFAVRYLDGRYGAVPTLVRSEIEAILTGGTSSEAEIGS